MYNSIFQFLFPVQLTTLKKPFFQRLELQAMSDLCSQDMVLFCIDS